MDNNQHLLNMTEMSRTDTGSCSEVSFVAHVTVAAEGSDGVDALAVAAQIWHHLALVDVWRCGDIWERDVDQTETHSAKHKGLQVSNKRLYDSVCLHLTRCLSTLLDLLLFIPFFLNYFKRLG